MIITDGMAAATTTGTAAAAHIEGVDFAGKTGTAQVVGGGDTHTKGGAKTPNCLVCGHDSPAQSGDCDRRPAGAWRLGFGLGAHRASRLPSLM